MQNGDDDNCSRDEQDFDQQILECATPSERIGRPKVDTHSGREYSRPSILIWANIPQRPAGADDGPVEITMKEKILLSRQYL